MEGVEMNPIVLVVDDNTDILCNVRDYLEMNDMSVETAVSLFHGSSRQVSR